MAQPYGITLSPADWHLVQEGLESLRAMVLQLSHQPGDWVEAEDRERFALKLALIEAVLAKGEEG